jgi:hypothetical protein
MGLFYIGVNVKALVTGSITKSRITVKVTQSVNAAECGGGFWLEK